MKALNGSAENGATRTAAGGRLSLRGGLGEAEPDRRSVPRSSTQVGDSLRSKPTKTSSTVTPVTLPIASDNGGRVSPLSSESTSQI